MVTREEDPQWSNFVFWIVSATISAEEQFINQKMSNDMVYIYLFGPSLKGMFRDAIGAVGNYGEIYNRSMELIVPRGGRNLLNTNPIGPQMYSFF